MDGKHSNHNHQQPPFLAKNEEGRWGTWVVGTPVAPQVHPTNQKAATWVAVDYIPSATAPEPLNPSHMSYSCPPMNGSGPSTTGGSHGPMPYGGGYSHSGSTNNPYVQVSPVTGSSGKSPMEMIIKVLGRCGKKLEDTTRKAGDVAGNVWHHLKTGPSITDAAMARLAQGTKMLAEGGHDKIFQQTFGLFPGEQLRKAYACYLSTSSGPVIGTLYVSTARLAFCSDNPLSNTSVTGQHEWIYYKVMVRLDQLRAVNSSANRLNPVEKYIQIVTADGHEFWFMGFVSYDKALKTLTDALQHSGAHYSESAH